jgi:predicted nucleotidyltransferase
MSKRRLEHKGGIPMALDYEAVNDIISQYIADVEERMPIDKVYLYGSFARQDAGWDSDVDLCFFSKDFRNETILNTLNTLWEIKRKYNDKICLEPNAFPASELTNDNPFVKEVLRTGKEIKIDR